MQREDEWRQGAELASAKEAVLSRGPDSNLDQAHLAYVARAEIKMSILSFSFVQLWGQDAPACRSNSPLSTPFLEGENYLECVSFIYTQHLGQNFDHGVWGL